MAPDRQLAFNLRIDADAASTDSFSIIRLKGTEALNQLYQMTMCVRTELGEDEMTHLLGRDGHLELSSGHDHRIVHGVVTAIQYVERQDHRRQQSVYRLDLMPRAWLMSLRRNSRIFQAKPIDEVIREVLAEHGIPSRWLMARTLPRRAYCTQYEETDLAFVMRLAAEAGLHFHFEQPDDETSLVATALDAAASQIAGGVQAAVGGANPIAGAPEGGFEVFTWLGGLREVMVFSDSPLFYPAIPEEGGASWTEQLAQVAQQLATRAGSAATDDIAGQVGEASAPLGEATGSLLRAGQAAVFAELDLSSSRELHFRPESGALQASLDSVLVLEKERQLHSLSASYRIHDPERPRAPLDARARDRGELADLIGDVMEETIDPGRLAREGLAATGDVAAQVGGPAGGIAKGVADATSHFPGGPLSAGRSEVYEHQPHFLFPDWQHDRHEPERILAAATRDGTRAHGESICPWLAAGHRFQLRGHPAESLAHEQVITEVIHDLDDSPEGHHYRNHFKCVPAKTHYVPPRPARRMVQVVQTAIVVGTTDIDTDAMGRVCVRFHWDRRREGNNPHTTCRLRTMQSWAGGGYGSQFIPRVGMEVVVGFDGGDPDQPIILGCVYNGAAPPPFALPARKSVSGFRTQSAPGGHDGNELSFDDEAGRECVTIGALRDLDITARHERRLTVEGDDRETVRGERHVEIGGLLRTQLQRGRDLSITGADETSVRGDSNHTVTGSATERVEGQRTVEVAGSQRRFVRDTDALEVDGNVTQRVKGSFARVVGGGEGPRSYVTRVDGDFNLAATREGRLVADDMLLLQCGNSTIQLSQDKIYISSPEVVLESASSRLSLGREAASFTSDGQIVIKGSELYAAGDGATLGLSSEASLEGSRVLLNSPSQAEAPTEDQSHEPTVIVLKDQQGEPIPNRVFHIIRGDGSEVAGSVDAEGRAEVDLDEDATIVFPGLVNPRGGA